MLEQIQFGVTIVINPDRPSDLLKLYGKPIDEINFELYRAKYGDERAAGYLQALHDMNDTLGDILHAGVPCGYQKRITRVNNLYFHNRDFLKSVNHQKLDIELSKSELPPEPM